MDQGLQTHGAPAEGPSSAPRLPVPCMLASSRLSVTPAPGALELSSGLLDPCMHACIHTHKCTGIHYTHAYTHYTCMHTHTQRDTHRNIHHII